MHNGLSICQNKFCKTAILAYHAYPVLIFNRPVVGKTTVLRQKSYQTHYYYYRIATTLAKAYKNLLL